MSEQHLMELHRRGWNMKSLLDQFIGKLHATTLNPCQPYYGIAYHYTSLQSINSILLHENVACLWASRHDCLNDVSEGTLPEQRFEQACAQLKESGKINNEFFNLIKDVKPNRTKPFITFPDKNKAKLISDEYKTYIVSLSEDSDALAMWNYYSKGSRYEGVNIGIDIHAMGCSLKPDSKTGGIANLRAVKVIYDEYEQISIIERSLLDLSRNYTRGLETSVRNCVGTLLAHLKPVFKLEYFAHEREVRLIVDIVNKCQGDISVKYRSNAGFMIPYIELDFDKRSVKSITLSPSLGDARQKEAQRTVVREMMESYGYQAKVESSNIPVRY